MTAHPVNRSNMGVVFASDLLTSTIAGRLTRSAQLSVHRVQNNWIGVANR